MESNTSNETICPVIETLKIIGGKWELSVIKNLLDGPRRFNDLLRACYGISSRTLSRILKNLGDNGIVRREIISIRPVTVVYTLTPMGEEMKPVIEAIRNWGTKYAIRNPVISD
ncbi:MAG: helix-turn-helix transcriptional regulator [Candidatus Thermoplasmatota archaeon]|jgi:DNA-binding HxlR family transcriptional regulator|nr:helix-turn-helix transcriptional regulator [Candidatus Thermoplasmatota archaeon]MCL5791267.1 helix-turn-helix transcriptional regulator [Candidatus Thermoplasmatota archaeon]